jgi:hypothetical protein
MFIVLFIAEFLVVFILGFLFVALPLTVLFGIPLFLILREHVRLTFWASCLAGVAVLYVPLSVLLLFSPAFKYALNDGHGPGWPDLVEALGVAGLGAVAGFVFWLIAAAGLKPEKQDAAVVQSGAQPRSEEAESDRVVPESIA